MLSYSLSKSCQLQSSSSQSESSSSQSESSSSQSQSSSSQSESSSSQLQSSSSQSQSSSSQSQSSSSQSSSSQSESSSSQSSIQSPDDRSLPRPVYQILYLLDYFAISDEAYHELSMLIPECPRSYLVKRARSALNASVHIERLPAPYNGCYRPIKQYIAKVMTAEVNYLVQAYFMLTLITYTFRSAI